MEASKLNKIWNFVSYDNFIANFTLGPRKKFDKLVDKHQEQKK